MQSVFAAPCCTVLTKLRLKNHFALPGHGETGQYDIINQKTEMHNTRMLAPRRSPQMLLGENGHLGIKSPSIHPALA